MNSGPDRVVDAHVHLWDRTRLDYDWLTHESGVLQNNFLSSELEAALDLGDVVISGAVAVQADCRDEQSFLEAQWLESLADEGAPITAIVANAPLERGEDCRADVEKLVTLGRVTGIRRLLQDRPGGFAIAPGFVDGVRLLADYGLVMDLCIRQPQLAEVTELASQCPEVTFVLDHLGKPVIDASQFDEWSDSLDALASLPNVRCKISGLMSEAPPPSRTIAALRPWIERAIGAFGASRCLYGSDWPVVTSASTYSAWYQTVTTILDDLSEAEQSAILGSNALAVYDPAQRSVRVKESINGAH